ncbi:hypothetical protein COCNU_02G007260 [Cocos nucifera]|uniref:Uncharacterized protein n=1 Tax=Cocos nucifera TaxID=13894 RepID=A0A8K0HYV5_COCNU|nr:hypothetical protein COCNU_02G007260 [Cocos nucifera]
MRAMAGIVGPLQCSYGFLYRIVACSSLLLNEPFNLAYKAVQNPPSDAQREGRSLHVTEEEDRELGSGRARFFGSEAMVSLQAALSPKENLCLNLENQLSKKRKREDGEESDDFFAKEINLLKSKDAKPDLELHPDTPFPSEWQRCLDSKSGQMHLDGIRTHKRSSKDPRGSAEPLTSCPSLDLKLNLTFGPPRSHINGEERAKQDFCGGRCNSKDNSSSMLKSSSWISLDADQPSEMVATVCMRCHMLVLMCKATLTCPSCKFVHPPNRSSSTLVKPGFKIYFARIKD